jgi:uncharacterized membrane protein YidH (DUF202 family)
MAALLDLVLVFATAIAQTTSTLAKDEGARNNVALPAMFLAVIALAALAIGAPRWARAINRRHDA